MDSPSDQNLRLDIFDSLRLQNSTMDKDLGNSDMRSAEKNKNLGYEQMKMSATKTLDKDLMTYFGFGKRQFKNIVKKPGVKFEIGRAHV